MDIATLGGLVAAGAAIISAIILGGSAETFFTVPSLVIVVVGHKR